MQKYVPTALILCALLTACQDTTPAGPPNVAGTYQGNMVMTMETLGSFTVQAEVDVQQSGREIDVLTVLIVLGERYPAARHVGDISDSGEFTYGSGRAPSGLAQCGDITRSTGTMKFSGDMLRWTATSETESCGDAMLEATLTRP